MKQHVMAGLAGFCLSGVCALAQQNEHEAFRRTRPTLGGRSNWVGRRVTSPEVMEKVGIQGEQAAKLKTELDSLDKQSQKLDDDIQKAAQDQAEVAKKVLSEPGANDEQLMQQVERIGKMRTEQAKLATKRLIVIRDNLTPEQREKVSRLMGEEQKRWHDEREARDKNGAPNRPAAPVNRPAAQPGNNRPPAPKTW